MSICTSIHCISEKKYLHLAQKRTINKVITSDADQVTAKWNNHKKTRSYGVIQDNISSGKRGYIFLTPKKLI